MLQRDSSYQGMSGHVGSGLRVRVRSEGDLVDLFRVVGDGVDTGPVDSDPRQQLVHDDRGVLQRHPPGARIDVPHVQNRVLPDRRHLTKLLLRRHPGDPPCMCRELDLELARERIIQADGPRTVCHEQPRAQRQDPHWGLAVADHRVGVDVGARGGGRPEADLPVSVRGEDHLDGRAEAEIRDLRCGAPRRAFRHRQEGVGRGRMHENQRAFGRADGDVLQALNDAGGLVALLHFGRVQGIVADGREEEQRRGVLVEDLAAIGRGDAEHGAVRKLEVADRSDLVSLRPILGLASHRGVHHELAAARVDGVVHASEPAIVRDGEVVVEQAGSRTEAALRHCF
mmetsp:Transcript_9729/g.19465  ORF Transcript_9729/g.19465 Transcript_9729/m.19465 type:complete len:341 (+) Transcript_9729:84-1106(+)